MDHVYGSQGKQDHHHACMHGVPLAELYDFEEPAEASGSARVSQVLQFVPQALAAPRAEVS
jgi:hypothetical protein